MASVNWVQVIVTVLSLMLSCGAMLFGAVWFLSARFERVATLGKQVAELLPKFGDLSSRVLALEAEVGGMKIAGQERGEDIREIRGMLGSLMRGNMQA